MNRKQLQALIIAIPVTAVFGIFAYFKYLVNPLAAKHGQLRGELDQIKSQYEQNVGRAARLPRMEQENAVLKQEIDQLRKKLPESKDVPSIIRFLSSRMKYHGINWKKLEPGSETAKEYYIEHVYKIPFSAPYHNLANFLADVGQTERIFSTRISPLKPEMNERLGTVVAGDIFFLIYTAK